MENFNSVLAKIPESNKKIVKTLLRKITLLINKAIKNGETSVSFVTHPNLEIHMEIRKELELHKYNFTDVYNPIKDSYSVWIDFK